MCAHVCQKGNEQIFRGFKDVLAFNQDSLLDLIRRMERTEKTIQYHLVLHLTIIKNSPHALGNTEVENLTKYVTFIVFLNFSE